MKSHWRDWRATCGIPRQWRARNFANTLDHDVDHRLRTSSRSPLAFSETVRATTAPSTECRSPPRQRPPLPRRCSDRRGAGRAAASGLVPCDSVQSPGSSAHPGPESAIRNVARPRIVVVDRAVDLLGVPSARCDGVETLRRSAPSRRGQRGPPNPPHPPSKSAKATAAKPGKYLIMALISF